MVVNLMALTPTMRVDVAKRAKFGESRGGALMPFNPATYYDLIDPAEPLEQSDPRNVDLDTKGTPDDSLRGTSWAHALEQPIALTKGTAC